MVYLVRIPVFENVYEQTFLLLFLKVNKNLMIASLMAVRNCYTGKCLEDLRTVCVYNIILMLTLIHLHQLWPGVIY